MRCVGGNFGGELLRYPVNRKFWEGDLERGSHLVC